MQAPERKTWYSRPMELHRCKAADGTSLHVETTGEGTPLVLTHGLGDDCHFWDSCIEALAEHHRVVRWDVRGFGNSDKPPGPYDVNLFAADLQSIFDHLDIDRAHLVGLSMGGVISQRFLLDHPRRVRSATLASTSAEISEAAGANWQKLATRVESRGFGRVDASRSFAAAFAAANPEIVAASSAQTASNDPAAYAAAARAMSAYDMSAELRGTRVPCLILQGLDDQLTPPGGSVRMHRAVPHSRLLLIPGAGHSLPIENPLLFASTVLSFTGAVEACA